jgi:uncharacterized membrane protein
MDGENSTEVTQPQTQNSTPSVDNTQLMSILAYIGILVLIPLLTSKENPTVRFHTRQGLVLFVIEIVVWFVGGPLWIFASIINLAVIVLSIIGIVNVIQKKEGELPIVGSLAKHINI